jgi:hypothetical protein
MNPVLSIKEQLTERSFSMLKIYEYFGLKIFFFANEHEPVHVHGRYQNRESKAELIIEEEDVIKIKISDVPGKRPLGGDKLRDFTILVHHKADDIRLRWIDFFVNNKRNTPEIITRRLQ